MSTLRVAVWDDPITTELHDGFQLPSGLTVEVRVLPADEAETALVRGDVDVALLPSIQVLLRRESL